MKGRRAAAGGRGSLGRLLSPVHAFLGGLLLLPAFLFQTHLALRAGQAALFIGLALLSGRRIRPWNLIGISAGIVLMNLLVPYGRVLFDAGPFSITLGALQSGLLKAATVVGLIYLSLFSIRSELPFPGTFGGLLSRVIYYFERILSSPRRLDRRNLIGSLDTLLMDICRPDPPAPEKGPETPPVFRTTPAGYLLLAVLVAGNWAALLLVRG